MSLEVHFFNPHDATKTPAISKRIPHQNTQKNIEKTNAIYVIIIIYKNSVFQDF